MKKAKQNTNDDFFFTLGLKANELDDLDKEIILSYIRLDKAQRDAVKQWMKVFMK